VVVVQFVEHLLIITQGATLHLDVRKPASVDCSGIIAKIQDSKLAATQLVVPGYSQFFIYRRSIRNKHHFIIVPMGVPHLYGVLHHLIIDSQKFIIEYELPLQLADHHVRIHFTIAALHLTRFQPPYDFIQTNG
jgi:hypothetical protein